MYEKLRKKIVTREYENEEKGLSVIVFSEIERKIERVRKRNKESKRQIDITLGRCLRYAYYYYYCGKVQL